MFGQPVHDGGAFFTPRFGAAAFALHLGSFGQLAAKFRLAGGGRCGTEGGHDRGLYEFGCLRFGGFSGGIGKNNIQAHAEKHNTGLAKSSKYRLFTPMWWHNDTGETLP